MKKLVLILILSLFTGVWAESVVSSGPEQSIVDKLIGKHRLSLQWISWDYFGEVEISKDADGDLYCKGEQLSRENTDYLKIEGILGALSEKELIFTGTIRIKIYHLNGGKEYVKTGTHVFKATKNRMFWRMQDMTGPDGELDYVDIFF